MARSVEEYRQHFAALVAAQLRVTCCPTPTCPLKGRGPLTLHQVRDRAAWETAERDDRNAQRVPVARCRCAAATWSHCTMGC